MAAGLTRFEPFRDLFTFQDAVNRLFFDEGRRRGTGETQDLAAWVPAVDIYEDVESLRLSVELPGIDPKDVDLRIQNNVLTLRAERKLENEEKRDNYHRVESRYGVMSRTFTLPPYLDVEKVKAEFKHGLLRVTIPKREETKPKQIKVNVQG
jgi:HSP20 family protein